MTILSMGEVLWDLFPSGKHMGGAAFNFSANCARLGHTTLFLSAVGNDDLGTAALDRIRASGVSTEFVQRTDQSGTGVVLVEFDSHGQPDYTLQRPAAYDFVRGGAETLERLAVRSPGLIYFGTLSHIYPNNRDVLMSILHAFPDALRFYDVNLRRGSFTLELLDSLMPAAQVAKFNEEETNVIQELFGTPSGSLEQFCRDYAGRFGWRAVCVTRGAEGCVILLDGTFVDVPGYPVPIAHPVGAGDAFSAAFCHGILSGWPALKIADFANRVGALVAGKPEAVSGWTVEDCYALTRDQQRAWAKENQS